MLLDFFGKKKGLGMTFEKLLNTLTIPIRWVDMDAYAHVNNSRFFDAMTEARADLLKTVISTSDTCQFILVDTQCSFKKPYQYPGVIIIKQYIEKIGNSSFTLSYLFTDENTATYATGLATMICFDPGTQKPIAIPDKVKALLNS
jgi:acyl-CoA thioester hydrolase